MIPGYKIVTGQDPRYGGSKSAGDGGESCGKREGWNAETEKK
jgi:hypothetical protein